MIEGPRIYNLFPLLAGTVQQWEGHLARIARMGFNWVYVNPFHYPGFSGSLYAIKDYYRVHDLMKDGDYSPDILIGGFCRQAKERGLLVAMDLVINHTSKDSVLVEQHPQWFRREADYSLYSPRAIDPADARNITIWGDLAELDYKNLVTQSALISYFCNVLSYFIECGVHGFRCDAAYQIPVSVWTKLIHFARFKCKDTVFFAETLGCRLEEVQALQSAGFDYLFNSAKWWDFKKPWLLEQYESFRHIAPSISFPESHDTDRLVTDLTRQGLTDPSIINQAYRLHYLWAAIFSTGLMIPIGYEFGFSNKLDVITTRSEHWERPRFDLSAWITNVNHLKASTLALNVEGPQYVIHTNTPTIVGLVRRIHGDRPWILTYINTDFYQSHSIRVEGLDADMSENREVTPERVETTIYVGDVLTLGPGEIRVFVGP